MSNPTKKKKSGHQFRIERHKREEEQKRDGHQLQNWLNAAKEGLPEQTDRENDENVKNYLSQNLTINEDIKHTDISPTAGPSSRSDLIEDTLIDFNDPTSWNLNIPITKSLIVQHGPQHAVLEKYPITNGRCFNNAWKTKQEGLKKIERTWLFYSKNNDALYCFPCILFGQSIIKTSGSFNNCDGFKDWKHLNPLVELHENSYRHIQNFTNWKIFVKGQRHGGLIDDSLQTTLKYEVNKWKHILKTVLKCIIFCAENNLSLRGHSSDINKQDCGIFSII